MGKPIQLAYLASAISALVGVLLWVEMRHAFLCDADHASTCSNPRLDLPLPILATVYAVLGCLTIGIGLHALLRDRVDTGRAHGLFLLSLAVLIGIGGALLWLAAARIGEMDVEIAALLLLSFVGCTAGYGVWRYRQGQIVSSRGILIVALAILALLIGAAIFVFVALSLMDRLF